MDPVAGQGISNAFRDAETLAAAVVRGLERGGAGLDDALAGYQRERDAAALPIYGMTRSLSTLRISPAQRLLFAAIADDPAATSRFFGVLSGAVRYDDYLRADNMLGVLGSAAGRRLRRALGIRAARGPAAPATDHPDASPVSG